jgi:hypothetical protein
VEDRVWVTKGAFPSSTAATASEAGILPRRNGGDAMEEGALDRLRTSVSTGLSALVPVREVPRLVAL